MDADFTSLKGNIAAQELLEIACTIVEKGAVTTLGVCGLGGAGKSTASRIVADTLSPRAQIFSIDWLLVHPTEKRRELIQEALDSGNPEELSVWEDPSAWYDWEGIAALLTTLVETRQVSIENAWNQVTGQKDTAIEIRLPSEGGALVLVDGIYLLHPKIVSHLDAVVLLDGASEKSFARGSKRDSHRSPAEYLSFKERLLEQFDVPYFEKYRRCADYIITTGE